MNATQLQCFTTAAALLNFTRAAEQLYITQPALSRNISSLEEELDLLLFHRKNNILELTPGGAILHEWLIRSESSFGRVLDAARAANRDSKQALRIAFVRSEAPTPAAAEALRRLSEAEPDIELLFDHYHAREIIEHLEEHRMDVAVMVGSIVHGHRRLVTRTLSTLQRCVAVPLRHPMAGAGQVSLSAFSEDVFISLKPEVSPTFTPMVRQVCGECGFTPMILEANSTEEQMQWVVSGKGVGLLVENHVQQNNPLYSFLSLEEDLPVELVCVWDRLNTNPHIARFVEAFQ